MKSLELSVVSPELPIMEVHYQFLSDCIVACNAMEDAISICRSKSIFGAIAVAYVAAATVSVANAAEITAEVVDGLNVIAISGDIELGDDKKFNRVALQYDDGVVVLESNGGNLSAALEIGKSIHFKGFSTYVFDSSTCASSCALIWIAGLKRFVSKSSHIGFHASYLEVDGRQEQTGVGNAIIGRYLTLLNLPEKAVIFATSASPDSALWLDTTDQSQSGIDFVLLETSNATETTAKMEPAKPEPVTQAKASPKLFDWTGPDGWRVFESDNNCTLYEVFTTEQKKKNVSILSVTIQFDQSPSILMFSNQKFASIKDGEKYDIAIVFQSRTKIDEDWNTVKAKSFRGGTGDDDIGNGFTIIINKDQILTDISANEYITFKFRGKIVDGFALKGSTEGVRQLKICAAKHLPAIADPFR